MSDNAEDCPVCLTTYSDTLGRPRNLPCGHTFCTRCINGLMEQDEVTCPTCRATYIVPETGHFPISYAVEALIRRLRVQDAASTSLQPAATGDEAGESAPSAARRSDHKRRAGMSNAIRLLLQDKEAKVMAAIHTCQEVQAQLHQYHTTLVGLNEQQQQLEERLQALLDKSKDARVLVQQEESKVTARKEEMQQREQQLHTLLTVLRTVATPQEADEAIDDADHYTDEETQKVEECKRMFPDVHTVTTITKVSTTSSVALEAASNIHEALETSDVAEDLDLPAAQGLSITDKLEAVQAPTIKVEDLRSLTQPTLKMLQAGLVFAVHQVEGRKKHARVTLDDDRLYLVLHSLRHQPLPPFAVTVQMAEVVPPAPPCLVFLDLQWPGAAPRRVLIRLSPDTSLARQFLLMCTGQRGPCYVNTKLLGVGNKGKPGEGVWGGDYEMNNGTGGAPLLPDLDKSEYRKSGKAGAVIRVKRGAIEQWNTLFGIRTRDCEVDVVCKSNVFGEVEAGLDVVVEAAQHSNIMEVTVVDCGVLL